MKIPDSITVNTGEETMVHEVINKFFLEVQSEIEKRVSAEKGPSKFRLDVVNLCRLAAGTPQVSDNYAHMLFYRERVVAVVFETRIESNYLHFDYLLNSQPL
jgi:hypothetical protein